MISGKEGNDKKMQNELATKQNKLVEEIPSSKKDDTVKSGLTKATAKRDDGNKASSPHQISNEAPSIVSETSNKNETNKSLQDNIPTIYFNIATRFSEYQLWRDALDHYNKVLKENNLYPGLVTQIDKMEFELKNQEQYQHGKMLITNGSYKDGIAILQKIRQKSFYYDKAQQMILEVKNR
jgi:hypothetical protein